jgi:hypothetical protein
MYSSRSPQLSEEGLDVEAQKTSIELELNGASISTAIAIFINSEVQELSSKKGV